MRKIPRTAKLDEAVGRGRGRGRGRRPSPIWQSEELFEARSLITY